MAVTPTINAPYANSDFLDVGKILIDSRNHDHNRNQYEYDLESMMDIIKYEFGHHLGIQHNRNQNHLMYDDDYEFPCDNLGYCVPGGDVENYESAAVERLA